MLFRIELESAGSIEINRDQGILIKHKGRCGCIGRIFLHLHFFLRHLTESFIDFNRLGKSICRDQNSSQNTDKENTFHKLIVLRVDTNILI